MKAYQDAQQQPNRQQQQSPPQTPATFHFRIWMILIPLCSGLLLYVWKNIDPVISWHKIMGLLRIRSTALYIQVFTLCVVATAAVIITKAIKRK